MTDITIKDVARLDIKPGETLLLWFEDLPRDHEGDVVDLRALLSDSLPDDVKIIAFEGSTSVGILSSADVERLTQSTVTTS